MFKKLKEVAEGRVDLLTVRCTEAWLERKPKPVLYTVIDENMEVLTTSRERREHYKTASDWLKEQLDRWKNPEVSRVMVATTEYPLEVVTGDTSLILVIEGKKYLLNVFRDIAPEGWLIPGGCPRAKEELLNPKALAIRECSEEVLIGDREGRIYNFSPSTLELEENIQALKLEPKEIISLVPKELPPEEGDAQKLVIKYGNQLSETEGVNIIIDEDTASLPVTLYWEVTLPVKFEELRIFDGEKLPNKNLLHRSIRLLDTVGEMAAIFSKGYNILSAGWINKATARRAVIPKNKGGK